MGSRNSPTRPPSCTGNEGTVPGQTGGASAPVDPTFDPNHPLEKIPPHLRRNHDAQSTEAGREELTLEQWRRRGFPEPTRQDFADARIMFSKSDGPRRGGCNPKIRPRIVMFDRNIVARKRIAGGRIPKRDNTARKKEREWKIAFNKIASARVAMHPSSGNVSDVSDDDTVDDAQYNDGGQNHNQRRYGGGPGPGTGGGGGGVAA